MTSSSVLETNIKDEEPTSPKINAFQFLMNSRHKVIGSNSPGKDKKDLLLSPENEKDKIKLNKRKATFEDWAEKKGRNKRKIADEAAEKHISTTLRKRAKRLKHMLDIIDEELKNSGEETSDAEEIIKVKTKKNKTPVIDSESSNDSEIINKLHNENITDKNISNGSTVESDLKSPKSTKNNNKENDKNEESKTPSRKTKNSKRKTPKKSLSLKKSIEKIQDNEKSDDKNELSDEEIFPKKSQEKLANTPKTRQLKLTNSNNSNIQKQECFSPRTWKMRVRLIEHDEKENDTSDNSEKEKSDSQNSEETVDESQKSGSSQESTDSDKKPVKLAPIFLIQQQKKLNKEALNAKKNFLHSGVPSKVKKLMTKTKSFQEPEIELSIFPKISHVQQRDLNSFWDLPVQQLPLKDLDIDIKKVLGEIKIDSYTNNTCLEPKTENLYTIPSKYKNIKLLVKEIKNDYPSYPVYKTFRLLYQKYEKHAKSVVKVEEKTPAKPKRGRGRKKKSPVKKIETEFESSLGSLMWTEKYKPQCQDDIIGNISSVQELKKWLESWIKYSEEEKSVRKRRDSNSSDDFCSDSTTKDSDSLPQNIIMLYGPFGSGKTCSVYGLCNELSINVIEINASSKRSGKKILADLQEATKSHQVKNTDAKSATSFFQKKPDSQTDDEINKKLSLLLFEDVDIVFEDQDDNFISALGTLIISSKRPIILTYTDKKCFHLQKFIMQYQVITFNSVSCEILSPWLQILCLIEGIRARKDTIDKFIEWNRGDVRKILLHLQFWVQTGGNPQNKIELDSKENVSVQADDEDSNLSWIEHNEENCKEENYFHQNCSESFIPYYERDKKNLKLSYPVNLETVWWNVPHILGQNNNENSEEKIDLKLVSNFLDSLSLTDLLYTNLKLECNTEPIYNYWQTNPENSLSLDQNYSTYTETHQTSLEIAHFLVETNVELCQKFRKNGFTEINTNIPYFEELSLRSNRQECMKSLLNAVPIYCLLDRKSICKDYQTILRTICRFENERLSKNTKRRNRFYHYLKNFNIHLNESSCLLLCNTFSNKC